VTPTVTPSRTITPTVSPTSTLTTTVTITPFVLGADQVITYPSPAKGGAVWFYLQAQAGDEVQVTVYNPVGEQVTSWSETLQPSQGYARVRWDLARVAPGIYLYRLRVHGAGGDRDFGLKKLAIVK
jgi:hypothetical protein